MVGLRDEDPAEARVRAGFGVVVVRELVEPFQVEGERAALAVEFDAQGVLASGREAGRLEGGEGAGGEAAGEEGGVVDGDGADAPAGGSSPIRRSVRSTLRRAAGAPVRTSR